MTDISPNPEHEMEDDEDEGPTPSLYVEHDTRLIYEVHFFESFALVRPASSHLWRNIMKLDLIEFSRRFDEFDGDHAAVHDFLRNGGQLELEVR